MHQPISQGKERIIAAEADVLARLKLGAMLADQNRAGADGLTGESLDTEILRVRVSTVAGRALPFLMCHVFIPLPGARTSNETSRAVYRKSTHGGKPHRLTVSARIFQTIYFITQRWLTSSGCGAMPIAWPGM